MNDYESKKEKTIQHFDYEMGEAREGAKIETQMKLTFVGPITFPGFSCKC